MIKNKLLLVTLLGASVALPAVVQAQDFQIQVGDRDRPFYTHGARYWEGDSEWVWVPGHLWRHHWIHGHYVRGEHRRHDWDRRHDGRRDDRQRDRHDDHRDDNRQ